MELFGQLLRGLPAFAGKQRLVRSVLKNQIASSKDIEVKGKFGCNYLLPNIVENVGFDIFINGIYEPETVLFLNRLLPEKGILIDVGANIGSISIPLCKQRGDIRVVAIEAAPWLYRYLERNVKESIVRNIELVNCAVYDQDETYISFFSPEDKFGKGSMAPVFTDSAVRVKTRTIDSMVRERRISKVDVIKVDVEGFEDFVFRGASELLSGPGAPTIYFEFVDWAESRAGELAAGAAQNTLMEFGYRLFKVNGLRCEPLATALTSGASNIIATKKKEFFESQ